MRKRIYEIIEIAKEGDILSRVYDSFMMAAIVISLIPLAFHSESPALFWTDKVCAVVFIIDYLLRLVTADYKLSGKMPFLRYPFTPMAIIDLISILPSVMLVNQSLKLLRLFRMARTLRVFRSLRYSKNITIIIAVISNSKEALLSVMTLAIGYVIISALIIFNIEPESFDTFFDSIYWATVSLTTVGYGDIYPVSTAGRIITMISSFFGIAIVALPAGIITAGYIEELEKKQ